MNDVHKRDTAFHFVSDMETPLGAIDDICDALCLVAEAMDGDSNVVMRLAMLAQEQCKAAEAARAKAFHLLHPGVTLAA
jgi:hypothetical protein